MSTPLETLLGVGYPVECKVIDDEVSVHWWPPDAKEGDPCLCGARPKVPDLAQDES